MMAQVRETRYLCDSCGAQVEKPRELHTFQLVPKEGSGYDYNQAVRTELCAECQPRFIEAVVNFFPDGDEATIRNMEREKK